MVALILIGKEHTESQTLWLGGQALKHHQGTEDMLVSTPGSSVKTSFPICGNPG